MKEKYEKSVTLKDVTPEAVTALLDFLYTAEIALTEESISDLLYAASIMQIQG